MHAQPLTLVIFGASGDLAARKLIPALYQLHHKRLLPDPIRILGIGRTELDSVTYRERLRPWIADKGPTEDVEHFLWHNEYRSMSTRDPDAYRPLAEDLLRAGMQEGYGRDMLFYLAVPPNMYEVIADGLARNGFGRDYHGTARLIVEKPFGSDLDSARALNAHLRERYREEQILRIDHYLGKETVQNVLVTRFSNGVFEPLWNRHYIQRVELTAAESLGVERRGGYYDQSGALRDMVQNHMMQLLGFLMMEPPASFAADAIRTEVAKVFQAIRPIPAEEVVTRAVRGQYVASLTDRGAVPGYREEGGVDPDSRTETYAALRLNIDNFRWGGVPVVIRTGKRLPARATEAVVRFRPTPHRLFAQGRPNELIIRIQPDEGILLNVDMKVPGAGFGVQTVGMDFHYADIAGTRLADAYERLLYDAMLGDTTLFARADAVEASWEVVDPVLQAWRHDDAIPLHGYPAGSWGPRAATALLGSGAEWRDPCPQLDREGAHCEL